MMQTASRVKLPYLKVERDAEVDAPRKRKRDKLVRALLTELSTGQCHYINGHDLSFHQCILFCV